MPKTKYKGKEAICAYEPCSAQFIIEIVNRYGPQRFCCIECTQAQMRINDAELATKARLKAVEAGEPGAWREYVKQLRKEGKKHGTYRNDTRRDDSIAGGDTESSSEVARTVIEIWGLGLRGKDRRDSSVL